MVFTAPDAWTEEALININDGTTDCAVHAITETIDIDAGDKDFDSIVTLSAGRLKKPIPETETTITFEGYPIAIGDIDSTSPVGLAAFFHGGTDTSAAFTASSSTTRKVFVVTIMWTNSTATSATATIAASGGYALRYNFQNCTMISCKPSFTDGILKATWVFKCTPFNKAGTANITVESTDNTASLPTI